MQLTLDHGMLTPLELAGAADETVVVPILVNCVQPPLPTMRRCLAWGRFLGEALRAYDGLERVAILGSGGLSHDVATPRMGVVNEEFDRKFMDLLAAGDDEALIAHATDRVHEAGNGAEEIRNWLVAHGAAAGAPFQTLFYRPMSNWYTGIGLGEWRVNA
jgi:aromatic ring-opening dioxygenase catalytic subunit (LigB family)